MLKICLVQFKFNECSELLGGLWELVKPRSNDVFKSLHWSGIIHLHVKKQEKCCNISPLEIIFTDHQLVVSRDVRFYRDTIFTLCLGLAIPVTFY